MAGTASLFIEAMSFVVIFELRMLSHDDDRFVLTFFMNVKSLAFIFFVISS